MNKKIINTVLTNIPKINELNDLTSRNVKLFKNPRIMIQLQIKLPKFFFIIWPLKCEKYCIYIFNIPIKLIYENLTFNLKS